MLNKKLQDRRPSTTIRDNRTYKRVVKNHKKDNTIQQEIQHIKVKTLAEIRAERNARLDKIPEEKDEAEVTSTSKEENPLSIPEKMTIDEPVQSQSPVASLSSYSVRKIRLKRKHPVSDSFMLSSSSTSSPTSNFEVNNRLNEDKEDDDDKVRHNTRSHNKSQGQLDPQNEEKMLDDVLLLEEDDDDYDITLKAEEDLLNDMDDD